MAGRMRLLSGTLTPCTVNVMGTSCLVDADSKTHPRRRAIVRLTRIDPNCGRESLPFLPASRRCRNLDQVLSIMNRPHRAQRINFSHAHIKHETSCNDAPSIPPPRRLALAGCDCRQHAMSGSASPATPSRVHSSVDLRFPVAYAQSMHGPTGMDTTDAFLGCTASGRLAVPLPALTSSFLRRRG
jgi:hypothetical protein